jgi:hypothetical protein
VREAVRGNGLVDKISTASRAHSTSSKNTNAPTPAATSSNTTSPHDQQNRSSLKKERTQFRERGPRRVGVPPKIAAALIHRVAALAAAHRHDAVTGRLRRGPEGI